MRILHVITGIRKAAGTSVFVCELANEQVRTGHEVTIVHQETWRTDNYPLDSRVRLMSKKDFQNMMGSFDFDIVHIHGLWEWMLHVFARISAKRKWPMVWSPHGALTPWAFHYKCWKKLPVWWLWQKRDLQRASRIHVTAQSEVEDVRRVGLRNEVTIVPLGVRVEDYKFAKLTG